MRILCAILLLFIVTGCRTSSQKVISPKYTGIAALPAGRVFPQIVHTWTNIPSPRQVTPPPAALLVTNTIVVLDGPYDRLNEVGTHVDFTVMATNLTGGAIHYQWYKWTGLNVTNRISIPGETNNVICIENVEHSDVAGYEVTLSSGGVEYTNRMANLSVQTILCGASVQGTVQTPVTAIQPTSGYMCGAKVFNYHFWPWHLGYPVTFYGPFLPLNQQIGPGANTTRHPRLSVMSYHTDGGTIIGNSVDTAVQIFNGPGVPGSIHYNECIDGTASAPSGYNARNELFLSYSTDAYIAAYQPVVYFTTRPSSGVINWSWRYHW